MHLCCVWMCVVMYECMLNHHVVVVDLGFKVYTNTTIHFRDCKFIK